MSFLMTFRVVYQFFLNLHSCVDIFISFTRLYNSFRLLGGVHMTTFSPIDEVEWYKDIGLRIKEARKELGLTQQELADIANLKRTSITNIEKGTQKTPVYSLYILSGALEKSFNDLLPSIQTGAQVIIDGKETVVTPKSEDLINDILNA